MTRTRPPGRVLAWRARHNVRQAPRKLPGPARHARARKNPAVMTTSRVSRHRRRPSELPAIPSERRGLTGRAGSQRGMCGGERGIRTPEGLLTLTRFPGVRLKPLIHLSGIWHYNKGRDACHGVSAKQQGHTPLGDAAPHSRDAAKRQNYQSSVVAWQPGSQEPEGRPPGCPCHQAPATIASTAACATSRSSLGFTPETPTAPATWPSMTMGSPPSRVPFSTSTHRKAVRPSLIIFS